MSADTQEDDEIDILLGLIPHAASLPFNLCEWESHYRIRDECYGASSNPDEFASVTANDHHSRRIGDEDEMRRGYACAFAVSPSQGSSSSSPEEEDSPLGPLCDLKVGSSSEKTGRISSFCDRINPESPPSLTDLSRFSKELRAMRITEEKHAEKILESRSSHLPASHSRESRLQNCSMSCCSCSGPQFSDPNLLMPQEARRLLFSTMPPQNHTDEFSTWRDLNGPSAGQCLDSNSQWKHACCSFGLSSASCSCRSQYGRRVQLTDCTFHPCPIGNQPFAVDQYCHLPQAWICDQTTPCWSRTSRMPFFTSSPTTTSNANGLCNRLSPYPNGQFHHSLSPLRRPNVFPPFNCDDSFILQGREPNNAVNRHANGLPCNVETGTPVRKKFDLNFNVGFGGRTSLAPAPPTRYNSLADARGYIYSMAKDQYGCRLLQKKFDEGTRQDVQIIFSELIEHVVELMINPFGNYLVQKLLEVCSKEQRMSVLLVVTDEPGELVKISLNTHGTRAVQKLIETLNTQQQISLLISALEPGFLELVKDLNGNHVVQRCLQCFSSEDNKFIFHAAAKHCIEIGMHRHGCCVLQRCIAYSVGEQRENLVVQVSANGLLLAQDPYGNYVIQYILELKIPSASEALMSQFEGNYVQLSQQKFSSNVVEKCLQVFGEATRSKVIQELLSTSQFEKLIQDPFANYVIQIALAVSKGPLLASLIEAIRPHAATLRSSPYCKRIISRALFKK